MAHDAIAVSARLSLHSPRRKPRRNTTPIFQPDGRDAAWRPVAWRKLAVRHLGRIARTLSHRQSCVSLLEASVANRFWTALRILQQPLDTRLSRGGRLMGFLPRRILDWSNGDVACAGRQIRHCAPGKLPGIAGAVRRTDHAYASHANRWPGYVRRFRSDPLDDRGNDVRILAAKFAANNNRTRS